MFTPLNNFNNNTQFIPTPMPQPIVQFVRTPMLQFPTSVVPAPVLPTPQMSLLSMTICPNQTLNSIPSFWDATRNMVVPIPQNLINKDMNGNFVPAQGYTFVYMNVPSVETKLELPIVEGRTRSNSSVGSNNTSRQSTPEPIVADKKRKYKHRSKQDRIIDVHQTLKEYYTHKGLYAGEDEVLRGFDTVRVHVKTYRGLNKIDLPLKEVENHPAVKILKIATPFSMKNKFQKKGFIVYLKLASVDMVPIVQEIFKVYEEYFNKCDIALKKEDKMALDRENAMKNLEGSIFDGNWDDAFSPRAMIKNSSLSA